MARLFAPEDCERNSWAPSSQWTKGLVSARVPAISVRAAHTAAVGSGRTEAR